MYNEMETYLETINWTNRLKRELPTIEEIINTFPQKKRLRILDLGCGPGIHLTQLAKNYPAHEFEGIDISEDSIKYAQSAIKDSNSEISFSKKDFVKEPICEQKFDVIYSLGNSISLMWGEYLPTETFKKISESLNNGGRLFFQILNSENPRKGYWTSKIVHSKDGYEIFTSKRFDPDLTTHIQHVDFITFYKKAAEEKFSQKVNTSSWYLPSTEELKNILREYEFSEIIFWDSYEKSPLRPKESDSLLCYATKTVI
ncbi:Trans-aconitate 2-methyltransferase [Candidatus Lokiarchaeum ossiferum]|uniref:Trans-aconitate 2-methyltransferase n=1 Tax=Candidatus Lokiarchaeum ossiferum TaxID=2951803 RepID=A0ABY6HVW3_9ARCH|nr:Trans-aconitate 2-methyltransferase [Candidatus Lokiarchaeum sp. B-35]